MGTHYYYLYLYRVHIRSTDKNGACLFELPFLFFPILSKRRRMQYYLLEGHHCRSSIYFDVFFSRLLTDQPPTSGTLQHSRSRHKRKPNSLSILHILKRITSTFYHVCIENFVKAHFQASTYARATSSKE